MASLLDMLLGRQTPLATQNGEITGPIGEPQGGLLGGLRNSSGALMGFGMGMLGGANQQEGFQNGMVGMQRGVLTDRQRKAMQEAQMEKLQMQAARKGLAEKYKMDPALADLPGVQDRILADRLDPDSATRSDLLRAQLEAARRGPQPTETERLISGLPAEEQLAARRAAVGLGTKTTLADEVRMRTEEADRLGMKRDDPRRESFILTGKMPREDAQPLTATDKKAILEADEGVMSAETVVENLREAKKLSKQAYEGFGASTRGYVTSMMGNKEGGATVQLDNLVQTNALTQLKAIFGGAPTEGEREILLKIQGSSKLPDAERQQIYDRAIKLAERRLAMNRERANEMRGGTFYKKGGGQSEGGAPAAPSPADPLGLR